MKKIFFPSLIILCLFSACSKDEIKIDKDNLLIGVWNFSHPDLDINIYTRAKEFTPAYCYRFNDDGSLIERSLAGFCATPPVSYSDYQGSWSIINDSLIKVNVGFWGGITEYRLKIVSVTADSLKVIRLAAED